MSRGSLRRRWNMPPGRVHATHAVVVAALLSVCSCYRTSPDVAEQFQRYADASASHDLETLETLMADDIVWQLGRYTFEGKEAALGPHAYDLGMDNELTFRDVRVDGNVVEFELAETNETVRAIGMTELRSYPRFTFANGLVVRKGPSGKEQPAGYSMAEYNRRMAPLREWIRNTHPEAVSDLLDAGGSFVFSRENGALMLRLTREWLAAGAPGRLPFAH
ncbi:MAG: nuclear transport factor 2 family protein [Acidobacteriota bacterium]|jgi:hypothetical protein